MFDLNQHVAIVTGGAQGIGAAIARRLADAGASIAVADLNLDKAKGVADSLGHDSFAVETNVALPESVRNTLTEVLQRAGKVDILVNNAGVAGRAAPIWEQTDEDWQATIAVNITGVFNFCRAVLPHMRTQSYGRIVNVASIAGKEGNPRMVPYSATKAAVIALTKSVAKEVATDGICVNAVSPAVVHTPILDQLTPEQVAYMTSRIPMGRTGKPEEIAAVVHFLASPDCSFVTGQCYDVSGGRATY
jgi:NAD(P)-dependent dehydrogenase (short-subunit alcohol dehydrogenase family)